MTNSDGCTCHQCGQKYKVDLLLSEVLWNLIDGKHQMLCGRCIMDRLEKLNEFMAIHATTDLEKVELVAKAIDRERDRIMRDTIKALNESGVAVVLKLRESFNRT